MSQSENLKKILENLNHQTQLIQKLSIDQAAQGAKLNTLVNDLATSTAILEKNMQDLKKDFESNVRIVGERVSKLPSYNQRGDMSVGFLKLTSVFVVGVKDSDDASTVEQEIQKHAMADGLRVNFDMVKVYTAKNGKKVAKVYLAPAARVEVLGMWGRTFSKYRKACDEAKQKQQPAPAPPSHLSLRDDLTPEGQEERVRLDELYTRLKAAGKGPCWRDGAVLHTRPGGPRSPPVRYVEDTEMGDAGAAGTGASTPDTRNRGRPAENTTPGTNGRSLKAARNG